jgi:hypothetical protein
MTEDYTPTTDEVRNWDGGIGTPMPPEEFDRWLAAHDSERDAARRHLETSPNGVEHLVIRGRCATCGKDHSDWTVAEPITREATT